MKHHAFGRMPFTVTNVGFGAWQIGGSWGDISEADGFDLHDLSFFIHCG
ncbi:hypothetical protein ACCS67_29395 [Rhizobium brockwellii]